MNAAMGLMSWWARCRHFLDGRRFRNQRGDYCDYLGALLTGVQGGRTLRNVFAQDAVRYGTSTLRGRLSAHWLHAYQVSGGDLYASWRGCFPDDELVVLRSAQAAGNDALVRVLAALARACTLSGELRRMFSTALWSAAIAIALLCGMLMAVPWWTVPRLMQAFLALPADHYGSLTLALMALARLVRDNWMMAVVLIIAGWCCLLWSFPNFVGPCRDWLDRYGCWRLYRQIHGLRVLVLLVILLGDEDRAPTRLRVALMSLARGASPWLAARLAAIRARIDAGQTGASSFDVGLLDREQYWFLADMIAARGLHAGLVLGSDRLQTQVLRMAGRQAQVLRWGMLLGAVTCMLALGLWHYAVIDELRRALMLFYASQ